MKNKLRHPIRQKIMTSLLILITVVVGMITLTMARFFHEDKRSYISDWVSISVLSMAEESRSLIEGYTQRLTLYSRLMTRVERTPEEHAQLRQTLFDEFPGLVEIAIYRNGEELESVVNQTPLDAAGLTKADLAEYRANNPLPVESILGGEIYLRNSTLSAELPTLTLAISLPSSTEEPGTVAAAVIRSDALLKLGARFKVFEVSIADAAGMLLSHSDIAKVTNHELLDLPQMGDLGGNGNRAGLTKEFTRAGTEMIGGVADVGVAGMIVTALIPKSAAYLASWGLLKRLLLVSPALMVLVTLGGLFWAHRITRPLERLSDATRAIAQGDFEVKLEVTSGDEIGALAGSFNQMATQLQHRDQELSVAHSQLIQSEKMAAFGQLGAGIAHEVKNPLAGIYGCAQLSLLELDSGGDIREYLHLIEKEADRCKSIIENLMKFARQEATVLDLIDVNPVIEDAMAIVNHQCEINMVKLKKEFGEDVPSIKGNANQLQQVLMNLIINAQQAMNGASGSVTITTRRDQAGRAQIIVRDTGPGIPKEIQNKLFEPFFTTKPTGEGTGLGLSVSFGIVRDHAGEITIESEIGEGAAFIITIPPAAVDRQDASNPAVVDHDAGLELSVAEAVDTAVDGKSESIQA